MRSRARGTLLLLAAVLLGACASPPPPAPAPAPVAPKAPPRDEATASAIEQVLAGAHRSADSRARDGERHPVETLLFFGIKSDMTVVELWPAAGGWYTEVLAPLLAQDGKLYVAQRSSSANTYITRVLKTYADKLAALPEIYGRAQIITLSGEDDIAPPGSADLAVSFQNLHSWMNLAVAPEALASIHHALKPGGILGVVDHRADPAKPRDPRAGNGYVNEEYAIELITAAGFELVARSEVNANPKDTKDYAQGVWTLPPDYRMGNRDRAKYEAIGESDRFTLKFRKLGSALPGASAP